jgi:ribosomal protein S18 acetylase RimI-like enzyme
MAAVEAQAGAWGAASITLDVQPFNADAIRFYQAIGYEVATYRMGRLLSSPP